MTPDELKKTIRRWRVTQRQFALLTGVSPGAVSQWLSGIRPVMVIIKLVNAMSAEERERFLTNDT